jgi:hypothetical protein
MEMTLSRGGSGKRSAIWFVFAALVVGGVAYGTGTIKTLGYEERHIVFKGTGVSTRTGTEFGLKRMVYFKGQTFTARYDVKIRTGALRIGILKSLSTASDNPHFVKKITKSGSGKLTYKIPETGLYLVYIDGSVLGTTGGEGYDATYSVRWGIL